MTDPSASGLQRRPWRRLAALVPLVALVATGVGCTGKHVHRRVKGDLKVRVQVASDLNRHSPVPVDLVLVYEEELAKQLLAMTAADWFAKKAQLAKDHEPGVAFDIHSWEWVPGQKVPELRVPGKSRAREGLVFALYHSEGAHRQRFKPKQNLRLELGTDDIQARPLK